MRLPMMETKQSTKRGRDETAGDALPLFLRGTMAAQGYPGHFRMYQRNLDGNEERVYRKYWKIMLYNMYKKIYKFYLFLI